jgi:hypothetical protein
VARPRLAIGLAAFVVAAASAGAGIAVATTADDKHDAGIVGRILCPVVLDRDRGCSQIKVVVRERSSHRRVATVKPSRFGRFRVALEPGTYLVELETAGGTSAGGRETMSVRVPPHRFVRRLLAARFATGPAVAGRLSRADAAATPDSRIHLSVRPAKVKAFERRRFAFVATRAPTDHRLSAVAITFAGARARTDSRGRAVIVHRFVRAGLYRARACKTRLRCGIARVTVLLYAPAS